MKRWKCGVCGYEHEGDAPPEKCPLCGVPSEKFDELNGGADVSASVQNKEKEKGHWKCSVCGYKHEGEGLPEKCPLCGVTSDKFSRVGGDSTVSSATAMSADGADDTTWRCTVCGYIHKGAAPPEKCPLCGVPAEKFVRVEPEKAEQARKIEVKSTEIAADSSGADAHKKKSFLDILRQLILNHHIHPISVHLPNGILPAALVFLVLTIWFEVKGLELAAFFNLIFVLVNMPVVLLSGFLEWQSRYRGATTLLFKTKIACSLVVIVCLTWLVGWRLINPEIMMEGAAGRWVYLFIAALMMAAAGIAGHLGGKLVFSSRD